MEDSQAWVGLLADLAIYAGPVLLLAGLLALLRRRGWRAPAPGMRLLVQVLPWPFLAWFALGLTSCVGAMGRVGAGNSEVPSLMLAGLLVAPCLWIAAVLLRRRVLGPRARNDADA